MPAGEAAAEDLHERLYLLRLRRCCVARGDAREELAVAARHGRDVLRLLLATLDLEAGDAGFRDCSERVVCSEVLGGDEEAAVENVARHGIAQRVSLAARLRARAAVGAALGDHPGHVALPAVRDAERTVHERLEPDRWNRRVDGADVVERVLARENDAVDAEVLRRSCAPDTSWTVIWVEPWISKPGIDAMDECDEADVLHDRRIDTAIYGLAEEGERFTQLMRLDQRVECEIHARAATVRDRARGLELVEGELSAVVSGVELLRAQIDGVGAVGDRGADGVQRAGWRKQFGNVSGVAHPCNLITAFGARNGEETPRGGTRFRPNGTARCPLEFPRRTAAPHKQRARA